LVDDGFHPERYDLDGLDLELYELRGYSEQQVALTHLVTRKVVLRNREHRGRPPRQHRDDYKPTRAREQ